MASGLTWGAYLCRGIGPVGELEVKPYFDPGMYPTGVNKDFTNDTRREKAAMVSDFRGRFENPETRDIARAELDIMRMLEEHGGLAAGKKVCDVGSGTGLFIRALSERVGHQGLVLANEISEVFSDYLRSRVVREAMDNVRVLLSQDARDPGLAGHKATVDLCFICDVYHHVEYPRTLMRHLRSALRPSSGRLVVIDFVRDDAVHTSHPKGWIYQHVRASQEEFRKEILSCGFELVAEPACPYIPENYVMVFKATEDWGKEVGIGWGSRK